MLINLNKFLFRSIRFCSSSIAATTGTNLTYPSKEFLNRFSKQRISNLIEEIEVIYKFADYVPTHLTDDNWQKLMDATSILEREEFLFQLSNNEFAIKKSDEKIAEMRIKRKEIFNKNKQLFETGSVVYGSTFYRLFGDEYFHSSKFVDRVSLIYGSRCCQNAFLNEFLPKILIDCRHLYQLHVKHLNVSVCRIQAINDYNMLSDYPLPISLVNFFSSEAVGHSIKKHFHFLFGPPTVVDACETDIPAEVIKSSLYSKLDDFLDKEEKVEMIKNKENSIYKYQPNPFIPEITTKSILDVCKKDGINKEEIAFISNSASQYLPDDAEIIRKRFKAFVFSPLEDKFNVRHRPSYFAPNEQLQVYRLPLEKYLGFRPPTFQSPHFAIELLKAIYSGRTENWNWAIDNRTPTLRIQDMYSVPNPWSNSKSDETTFAKIKDIREEKLKLIEETLKKQRFNNLKINNNNKNQQQNQKLMTQAMTKQRNFNRKYSRQERFFRRQEETKLKMKE